MDSNVFLMLRTIVFIIKYYFRLDFKCLLHTVSFYYILRLQENLFKIADIKIQDYTYLILMLMVNRR
jgi:hypothetical protein